MSSPLLSIHFKHFSTSSVEMQEFPPSSFIQLSPKEKREWDRNRSFVRIRFRRPTSAQLSRGYKS